ncbi:Integrase, catalytic core [Corchorus capsularis]|uniref:Integrase, catalytic core n=1 Tax=Corchorus capsularis TaxID=210143 RepID=A0A1R3JZ78_COCAP|nr:Integrase, catalytic core [Corchorus capsularis]
MSLWARVHWKQRSGGLSLWRRQRCCLEEKKVNRRRKRKYKEKRIAEREKTKRDSSKKGRFGSWLLVEQQRRCWSWRRSAGFETWKLGFDRIEGSDPPDLHVATPTNVKELKSFLGRLSYIRRFIPGLAASTTIFTPLLRKGEPYEWEHHHEEAFIHLKKQLQNLPTVQSSAAGKPLRLYLAMTDIAIGGLLAQHYFLAHEIHLITKSNQIRYILAKPSLSGRLANWLLQLSQYSISCHNPSAIKGQVVAYLLAQFPGDDSAALSKEIPGMEEQVLTAESVQYHTLYFDGSSTAEGGGAGIVILDEKSQAFTSSYKLDFPCSNNVAEYEAYLIGLLAAKEKGIKYLRVKGDSNLVISQVNGEFALKEPTLAPYRAMERELEKLFETFEIVHIQRGENRHADSLVTLGSKLIFFGNSAQFEVVTRVSPVTDQPKQGPTAEKEDWRSPIKKALLSDDSPSIKELKDYILINGELYRRMPRGILPDMRKEASTVQQGYASCNPTFGDKECLALDAAGDWRANLGILIHGVLPQDTKKAYALRRSAVRFFVDNGILFRKGFTGEPLRCLSAAEAIKVMAEIHSGDCGEYQGKKKLYQQLISCGYYWPQMKKVSKEYVKRCSTCQFHGGMIHTHPSVLQDIQTPWPFNTWGLDLIGPIHLASDGKIWILLATKYFTKWVEVEALGKATGPAVSRFIKEAIICRFGAPHRIITDNGTPFVNQHVGKLLDDYEIRHRRSTAYYPQGNGQAEATNKVLLKILSKMVYEYKKGWTTHLPDALWAYRVHLRSSTGFSPYSLVYGAEAILPVKIIKPTARVLASTNLDSSLAICGGQRLVELEAVDEIRE